MDIRCAHCLQVLQMINEEIVRCEQHPYGVLEAIPEVATEAEMVESSDGLS